MGDVARILTDLTRPEKSKSTKHQYLSLEDHVNLKINDILANIVTKNSGSLEVDSDFTSICKSVLLEYLSGVLRRLQLVSRHRAGLSAAIDDGGERLVLLEEFLLFKEDCATYLRKTNDGSSLLKAPVFVKEDYAAHGLEEEDKLLLTAQSVRRINARDLLAVIPLIKMPHHSASHLINKAAFFELTANFTTRGADPPIH